MTTNSIKLMHFLPVLGRCVGGIHTDQRLQGLCHIFQTNEHATPIKEDTQAKNATIWNSLLRLLESVLEARDEVNEIMKAHNKVHLLGGINRENMK